MNHKRGRPRNQRAGCKMCKYWKINSYCSKEASEFESAGSHRHRSRAKLELDEFLCRAFGVYDDP